MQDRAPASSVLFPDPNSRIVVDRAPIRTPWLGTGKRIDAEALLEGAVGPDALAHHHPRLHPVEPAGVYDHAGAAVAQAGTVAVTQTQPEAIIGVHQHGRPALAFSGCRSFGKATVEELTRRRGHQSERVLIVSLVYHVEMIRQRRHIFVKGALLRPVRLEAK